MSYATIRAAISTAIGAVAGITGGAGKVLTYQPHIFRSDDYVTLLANDDKDAINAWTISRTAVLEDQEDPGFRIVSIHDIIVRGWNGLRSDSDSSPPVTTTEEAFQDLVDAVRDAIRGSTAIWPDHPQAAEQAIQTEIIGQEMYGSALLHTCTMRFQVEEIDQLSS